MTHRELCDLVSLTRHFLEVNYLESAKEEIFTPPPAIGLLPKTPPLVKPTPTPAPIQKTTPPAPVALLPATKPSTAPLPAVVAPSPPILEPSRPKETPLSRWQLLPPSPPLFKDFSTLKKLWKRIDPQVRILEPTTPFLFLTLSAHAQPFLEKVAQALTQRGHAASVELAQAQSFTAQLSALVASPALKVIILPLSMLQLLPPALLCADPQPHTIIAQQAQAHLFLIRETQEYERNLPLKQQLWQALLKLL